MAYRKKSIRKRVSIRNSKDRLSLDGKAPKQQYRSTLNPMREIFQSIGKHLQPPHLKLMAKTPFRYLFEAFMSESIVYEKRKNVMLDYLIESYSRSKGFKLGSKYYIPTREDVRLIFGILDGKQAVGDMSSYPGAKSSLRTRLFYDVGRIKVSDLKRVILDSVIDPDPVAVSDTVKCLCLLLIGTLFFSTTGQGIAWYFCYFVDKLSRLSSYDWSGQILKELLDALDRPWSCPRHVKGCTLFLLYWFCEHSYIIQDVFQQKAANHSVCVLPGSTKGIPRLTKWNLKDLQGKLTKGFLRRMRADEFRAEDLCPTPSELMHLSVSVDIEGSTAASFEDSGYDSGEELVLDTQSVEDTEAYGVVDDSLEDTETDENDVSVGKCSRDGQDDESAACDVVLGASSGSSENDESEEDSGTDSGQSESNGAGAASSSEETEFETDHVCDVVASTDVDLCVVDCEKHLSSRSLVGVIRQAEIVLEPNDTHPIELDEGSVKSVGDIISDLYNAHSIDSYEVGLKSADVTVSPQNDDHCIVLNEGIVKSVDALSSYQSHDHPIDSDQRMLRSADEILFHSKKRPRHDRTVDASIPSFALLSPTPSPVSQLNDTNLPLVCYTNSTCTEDSEQKILDVSVDLGKTKTIEMLPYPEVSVGLEMEKTIERLKDENTALCISLEDSDKKITDLLHELALYKAYEARYVDMKNRVDALEFEHGQCTETSDCLKKQVADAELKNMILVKNLHESTDLLNFKDAEISKLNGELEKVRVQIAEARSMISLKDFSIKDLEIAKHQLECVKDAEIKYLSLEVGSMKVKLADALSMLNSKQSEIERMQGTVVSLETSIHSLTVADSVKDTEQVLLLNDPSCESGRVVDSSVSVNGNIACEDNIEGLVVGAQSVACVGPVACPASGEIVDGTGLSIEALVVSDHATDKNVVACDAFVDLTPDFLVLSKNPSGKKVSSVERGVKENPRKRRSTKKDIMFSYSVGKKKQRSTLSVDDKYWVPKDNPVDSQGKLILFENKDVYACGPHVLPEAYSRLLQLHKESDSQAVVWVKSSGAYPWVYLPHILHLLNSLYVEEVVLEGVIQMLRQCSKKKDSICFVSTAINAIIHESSRDGCFFSEVLMDFLKSLVGGKTLFIPLCCYGSMTRPYHWVLLTYKLGDVSWYLYNSLYVDGRSGDAFLKECVETVRIIVGVYEKCIADGTLTLPNSTFSLPDQIQKKRNICLQDDEINCGLFVAYYMFKLSEGCKIPTVVEDTEVQKWKGNIVNSLVLNTPELIRYEL